MQIKITRVTSGPLLFFLAAMTLLTVSTFAPALGWAAVTYQSQEDIDRLKGLSGRDFEVEFVNLMIPHHQDAIDMSRLAPDQANHQEVKDAAQKIIVEQTREINNMTTWLRQWYNTAPNPKGDAMGGMGHSGTSASDLTKLRGLKGDGFDREYLTMMRAHHQSAIEMAELVARRATHDEMNTLAQNIISSQRIENEQFERWLKAWYNVDVTGGGATGMSGMPGGDTPSESPRAGSSSAGLLIALAALVVVAATLGAGLWLRSRA